jgi:hypothetical protein
MRLAILAWYLVVCLLGVATQAWAPTSMDRPRDARGAIVHKKLTHGEYIEYLPKGAPRGMLVIAHGSTAETTSEQDFRKLVESYITQVATY